MNKHPIHSVTSVTVAGKYTLKLQFEDGVVQVINFEPILRGQLYGPLRDQKLFEQVRIDPEVCTIVWPNGADFDPATLHDWPEHAPALIELAKGWELCSV
jgi:hypothetical protein